MAAVGTTAILTTKADEVGAAMVGAAAAAAPAVRHLRARQLQVDAEREQLRATMREFTEKRDQYTEAYATLNGQRERIRANTEGRIAELLAAVNARHQDELVLARADAYEQGAKHMLAGIQTQPPRRSQAGTNILPFGPRH